MPSFRGLKLPGFKDETLVDRFLYVAHPPAIATIPLLQHKGAPAKPIVKTGDKVLLGQKIAASVGEGSAAVHASVSGEVIAIGPFPHPHLGVAEAIQIKNDGLEMPVGAVPDKDPAKRVDDELMRIVEEAGLVDLNEEGEPLAAKLKKARASGVRTLIVNACESEPFITALHVMMVAKSSEIIRGILLAEKLSGATKVIVAIEDNKLDALEVLGSRLYGFNAARSSAGRALGPAVPRGRRGAKEIELKRLPVKYPQGDPAVLVSTLTGCSLDKARDPLTQGVLVLDMATCFALCEAVYSGKPLYERVVTVSGQSVARPKNLLVRIGTSLENVLAECAGILRSPLRVLVGGPMRGTAQAGLSAPITKQTSALLSLSTEVEYPSTPAPCIRCGACAEVCPAELEPAILTLAAEQDEFEIVRDFHISQCIECGNCTYICPSKRPMSSLLKYAKAGRL